MHTEALSKKHRLQSSSFLGLPYRILNINHKEELLCSPWVNIILPAAEDRELECHRLFRGELMAQRRDDPVASLLWLGKFRADV